MSGIKVTRKCDGAAVDEVSIEVTGDSPGNVVLLLNAARKMYAVLEPARLDLMYLWKEVDKVAPLNK